MVICLSNQRYMNYEKGDLVGLIEEFTTNHITFNFMSQYFLKNLVQNPDSIRETESRFTFDDGTTFYVNGAEVLEVLKWGYDHSSLNIYIKNFIISEAFERIKAYCSSSTETNRNKFFNDVSHTFTNTLNYLRVLRNNASHYSGDKEIDWRFYKFESVTWNNRTITRQTTGNEIGINMRELNILLGELKNFIIEELD